MDKFKTQQPSGRYRVVSSSNSTRKVGLTSTELQSKAPSSPTKRSVALAKHYAHKLHEWKSAHQYLGRYSVQKLLRFDEYQRTTSLTRVMLWIFLTPLPSLLLIIAVAVIPLENPLLGAALNSTCFMQSALSYTLMTFALLLFMRMALGWIDHKYPHWVALMISVLTAASNEAAMTCLAFGWRFPVPFRDLLGMVSFAPLLVLFHMAFLGKFILRNRHHLGRYMRLFLAQCSVLFVFVVIAIIFRRVAYSTQVALTLLFPFLRAAFKRLIWRFASCLDDISTDISVCVIEIFGSLYQNSCLQNVRSPEIAALMVLIDFSQAVIETRMYLSHKFIVDGRTAVTTALKILESALPYASNCDENGTMVSSAKDATVIANLRSVSVMLDPTGTKKTKVRNIWHRSRTCIAITDTEPMTSASDVKVDGVSSPRKRESVDQIMLDNNESAKLLEQTLQLLFASEVLVFVEYVEVALPIVFGIYTAALSQLPYAAYSTAFIGTTRTQMTLSLASTAVYVCFEALSLVFMVVLVQRKYGFNALYQLGFVLETYWPTIQGKLMGSLVLIFNLSTVHHGKSTLNYMIAVTHCTHTLPSGLDLSLQFDWERVLNGTS
ncbi:TPA: hypothetical protein N0F65_008920 [Lagenidium giganteum]|uniref:Transmembrane protein n=1 Tax=Lagenidium giganteum TaxID=4803 RepID=A0AAV2YU56_9STRA|nr:TPA: hypothetical protein N0F65_008920 [Lagenidium giganteum]